MTYYRVSENNLLTEIRTILKIRQGKDVAPESLNISTCETMSVSDELESKIQNREQFNLLVSKTLITPLILLLISNIECAQEVVNHRYLNFQRWYEVEICSSDIHYEVITISDSTDLVETIDPILRN